MAQIRSKWISESCSTAFLGPLCKNLWGVHLFLFSLSFLQPGILTVSFRFISMQSRATGIADHVLPLGDLFTSNLVLIITVFLSHHLLLPRFYLCGYSSLSVPGLASLSPFFHGPNENLWFWGQWKRNLERKHLKKDFSFLSALFKCEGDAVEVWGFEWTSKEMSGEWTSQGGR